MTVVTRSFLNDCYFIGELFEAMLVSAGAFLLLSPTLTVDSIFVEETGALLELAVLGAETAGTFTEDGAAEGAGAFMTPK